MARNSKLGQLLRASVLPTLSIIFIAFFGYSAVFGPNGVLAYRDYQADLAQRKAQLTALEKQRDAMRNRVNLLDPRRVDPDMAEELIRKKLHVAHPDEVIVPVK